MKHRQSLTNRIRFFNKRVLNRVMLKFAGSSHSPIAVIRHVGRRTRKSYGTPVIVEPVDEGFIFALTYGLHVDWYRNVMAAGRCVLVWHGREYTLGDPEALDVKTALHAFPFPFRLILQILGIQHFLRMKPQQ